MQSVRLVVLFGALALLSACHRAPQTAAELMTQMPRQYAGQLHWQGQTGSQPVRIECRELAVRSEHLLAFSGVNVVLLDPNGAVQAEHFAASRGTISAPGFAIQIEDLGAPAGGEDVLKAGSFSGKLSDDLKTAEGAWTTGFGTKGSFRLSAVKQ